jgi:hypothetical protein
MASKRAVASTLKALARNFAGEITTERVALYHAALQDVGDDALRHAAVRVVREYTGQFLPPVAVLRDAAGANHRMMLVDGEATLQAIARLGQTNQVGRWFPPYVETVRVTLGESIAIAYAAGGAGRLFADNETTRDIARRDFQKALEGVAKESGPAAIALPRATAVPALPAAEASEPSTHVVHQA